MKKRITISLLSVFFVLLLIFFISVADKRMPAKLPEEVKAFSYHMTSSFLIPLPEGYLMFDTGYEKSYGEFKRQLRESGIMTQEIKYLILSHHHDDHSGFTNRLLEENPAIRVILHQRTVPLISEGNNNTGNGGGIINPAINTLFRLKLAITPGWDFTFPPFTPRDRDIILKDDLTDLTGRLGINAAIISTPGHTSDSISLIYNEKYLFCGDLASNMLNFFGAANLTIFNEDLKDVYDSWEKVLKSGSEVIIPSHGRPFSSALLYKNMRAKDQSSTVPYI